MFVTVGNNKYHVNIVGDGEPIVMLHGFTGTMATWNDMLLHLSYQGQLILIDLPGHGDTQATDVTTMYDVCHDLKLILEQLGHQQVSLLGYSMGGRTSFLMAYYFPDFVERLILVGASPGLPEEQRIERQKQDEQLATMIEREGMEAFVSYWETIPLFDTQRRMPLSKQEQIRNERLAQSPQGLALSLRTMGTGKQPSLWSFLQHMTIPVTLVVGEEDDKFISLNEQMLESLPNAELKKISQTGHAVHLESPEIFGKIVSEVLIKPFSN
ncbi:2-succinyl-6-hydroxy-2,4-cyclohexadiene-1-carboxylate synthase [Alkalibacillus flavidus]|uniref:Putative 2-succinyl-6-hydroxy-2,4-cyclohexadiene-1-carboxylate synthase n=1 Tax=Alkalibacillus flavidus TaxID=546021 RepID=A0ABV2KW80_9BACI